MKRKIKNNFCDRIYLLLNKVPGGKVVTYKQIGEKLNSKAYRTIGNCLNKNKNLINVPCHRVINSNGNVGGYVLGEKRKSFLLKKEGVKIVKGKINLKEFGFRFK